MNWQNANLSQDPNITQRFIDHTCRIVKFGAGAPKQDLSSSSANKWVAEEIRYYSLRERLYHLVSSCNAAIALSGGIGTLSEVALAWSLIQTGEIAPKPLVLVGRPWQSIMHTFMKYSEGHVQKEHQELLTLLDEETAAVGYLGQAIGDG